jgi:hypothetical protein
VGYVEARANDGGQDPEVQHVLRVAELAVLPGRSLRAVAVCLGPVLQAELEALNATRAQPLTGLALNLGPQHPAYTALGDLLEQYRPYYAWYIRVPDLPAFLRHIAPARCYYSGAGRFRASLHLRARCACAVNLRNGRHEP